MCRKLLPLLPLVLTASWLMVGCDETAPQRGGAEVLGAESRLFQGTTAYGHCEALCAMGPRPSGSAGYEQQLAYLQHHLQQAGWQVYRVSFAGPKGVRFTNLHAVFPKEGKEKPSAPPTDRPMLISCHIDTKIGIENFVGADDGASGAAVILELARVLALKPQMAHKVELVFFDGEESFAWNMTEQDGLYGSRYDVARRGEMLPRWQINLDMVGGRGKVIAPPALDTSQAMLTHYEAALAATGLPARYWTLYMGSYLDDHRPFADAGVHSLNLICRFTDGDWWHTEQDDMSRICPHSLQETGVMVLQLLHQILP